MKWTTYKRKQSLNNKIVASSFIYDTMLARLLQTYNFHIKSKTSPIIVLDKMPSKYHHLFWRGYFDGDGCLTIKNKRPPSSKYKGITGLKNGKWESRI